MDLKEYSFCEPATATGHGSWCLRKLTEKGQKLGGGVDTPSLCGRVKPPYGWDLKVTITQFHLDHNTCKRCLGALVDLRVAEVDKKP